MSQAATFVPAAATPAGIAALALLLGLLGVVALLRDDEPLESGLPSG